MKNLLTALVAGIVFGFGLSLSQMTNPAKVINFLDVTGQWDPSLVFVMIGALSVSFIGFKWVLKRSKPVLESHFHLTEQKQIDQSLLSGAALFGVGWGMTGYCPGPAVTNLGLGSIEAWIMVTTIYIGFLFQKWLAECSTLFDKDR